MKKMLYALMFLFAVSVSSQASAATSITSDLADGSASVGSLHALGQTFTDIYSFTLSTKNSVSLTASYDSGFDALQVFGISGFNVSLYSGTYGDGIADSVVFSDSTADTVTNKSLINLFGLHLLNYKTYGYADSTSVLAKGNYYLAISGTSDIISAYSATVNLTPVPEADMSSMMFAGLGLVGFVAARRRKQA